MTRSHGAELRVLRPVHQHLRPPQVEHLLLALHGDRLSPTLLLVYLEG